MIFQDIRDSIRRVLAQNANGEFDLIGAQKRGKSAEAVKNLGRLVEVYYYRGEFPKSGGSVLGPTRHDFQFRIDMTVAQASKGDIDTIQNPGASADAVARAIRDMKESELLADESLDDLFAQVYQILMDARNIDFDLPPGTVGSRWVSSLSKDEPIERGNFTILTGSCMLTGTTSEPVEGYKGIEVGPVLDVGVEVETDIPGKAGVEIGA